MINSPIDEIKSRLDIVEVMGGYLKLQKAGANYRALCPFHSEKKPSLFVSPTRQIWKCFGCGAGGGIFDFVMKIEGVEFGEALRILAKRAGVELKKPSPAMVEQQSEKARLYEICELACQFFERQLEGKTGEKVRKYLSSRGVAPESVKKWRIGYAPDTWQGLTDFLLKKGYRKEEVEKAGLDIKNERGSFYDRFRGRIIFPIFDLNSQIVGFGGRVFGEQREARDIAKYMNTPNTLLYDKSRILYGLDKAKLENRKKDFCILVEGYLDAILVSQAGFPNVAAVAGTALTSSQLQILKRYSDNLYTAFDMDIAGDSATRRGIDLAQAQGFNIKVIIMPPGKDPADVASENPEEWKKLVNRAKSILKFYFETALARFDPKKEEGKVNIAKILLPVIKRIPNRISQSHWIQELSSKLKVREEDLETELKKVKLEDYSFALSPPGDGESSGSSPEDSQEGQKAKNRKDLLEERILSLVLKYPSFLNLIQEDCRIYFSPFGRQILKYLEQNPNHNFLSMSAAQKEVPGFTPQQNESLNYLCLASEANYNSIEEQFEVEDLPKPEEEMETCVREIKNFGIKSELSRISGEIRTAEENGEAEKADNLARRFSELSQKLIKRSETPH